jgi:hypothetical protein
MAIHLLQTSNDFLGGEFATTFPFVHVSMSDEVVHREDSLRYAFVVHDRQAPHLSVCHGVQSFMNFVIRLAREDISCGDLSDG